MGTLPCGKPLPQDVRYIFDAIDDASLTAKLHEHRWTRRKGYSPTAM